MTAPGASMAVVGLALAGGESRRMGRDKALLAWETTDLLGHTLARLQSVTSDLRIVSGREPRYRDRGLPVETDPGIGPLGGVLAGLAQGRPALVLAVDLPLVPVALLARLVDRACDADAVVPATGRGPEPLCAFYSAACLEPIRYRVSRGERRMDAFWPDVRVLVVRLDEMRGLADGEALLNVNDEDDYARALSHVRPSPRPAGGRS